MSTLRWAGQPWLRLGWPCRCQSALALAAADRLGGGVAGPGGGPGLVAQAGARGHAGGGPADAVADTGDTGGDTRASTARCRAACASRAGFACSAGSGGGRHQAQGCAAGRGGAAPGAGCGRGFAIRPGRGGAGSPSWRVGGPATCLAAQAVSQRRSAGACPAARKRRPPAHPGRAARCAAARVAAAQPGRPALCRAARAAHRHRQWTGLPRGRQALARPAGAADPAEVGGVWLSRPAL